MVTFNARTEKSAKRVGVIVPMEHEALAQIVQGLEDELNKSEKVAIKVFNAGGDTNIQRACIEQCVREQYDVIIPIGTSASEMTLNIAQDREVICLAADLATLPLNHDRNATVLDDNLSPAATLSLCKTIMPDMKKLTLVYSSSEKVAKEVPQIQQSARQNGIKVQSLMVQNLSELYTISRSIDSDSNAIFVLKDHLVVSGIQTLVKQAEKKGFLLLPLMKGLYCQVHHSPLESKSPISVSKGRWLQSKY